MLKIQTIDQAISLNHLLLKDPLSFLSSFSYFCHIQQETGDFNHKIKGVRLYTKWWQSAAARPKQWCEMGAQSVCVQEMWAKCLQETVNGARYAKKPYHGQFVPVHDEDWSSERSRIVAWLGYKVWGSCVVGIRQPPGRARPWMSQGCAHQSSLHQSSPPLENNVDSAKHLCTSRAPRPPPRSPPGPARNPYY